MTKTLVATVSSMIVMTSATAPGLATDANHPCPPREVHPVLRSIGPTLVHKVTPRFPRKAARAGLKKGMVVLQVLIDINGHTGDSHVLKSEPAGFGFEEAALRAVAKWRYEPYVANGEAKSVYYTVTVDFQRRPEA